MKRHPYRNAAILKAAEGEECTMNSPWCNYNPETVVFCHGNYGFAGKGLGQKADDCCGFFGCSDCHEWYDTNQGSQEGRHLAFLRAYYRTIRRLLDKGTLS